MKRHGILLVCVWLVLLGLQANGVYNVHDYGANGDGMSLDHIAINKAIEAATANGGGQVVLSPGTYLCGSIRLKSNVDLHLEFSLHLWLFTSAAVRWASRSWAISPKYVSSRMSSIGV